MMNEAPYKTVNHALRDAYYTAVKVPYKVPSLIPSSGSFDPKGWDDFAGDAGMIMRAVRDTLSFEHQTIVNALYVIPEDSNMESLKQVCCNLLSDEITEYHPCKKSFLLYLIRQWSGYSLNIGLSRWAEELQVTERTLRNWKMGWTTARGDENGIYPMLDRKLDAARSMLAPEFRLKGWID